MSLEEPLKFAYWVPNVSGGLVTSDIEQRTDWGYEYNRDLAVLAENSGFEYALSQVRYTASYGASYQHESTGFSLALLLATQRLKVIAAVHPGLWHPGVLAKFIASADVISGGRAAVNVVSGWFKGEFTGLGEPWLEHRIHDFDIKPKPVAAPHPEIFQGGNSTAARKLAGSVSDWYFSNGKDFDGFSEQVAEVRGYAASNSRTVRFGLNGFVIARSSEGEARAVLREIVAKANVEAVEGFRSAVAQAGKSTSDAKGMWADSGFEDLVQYNDGFRTQLIGTPEQIADRAIEYKKRGASLLLLGFLHYLEDVEHFGKEVLPVIRAKEQDLARGAATPEPLGV
ncbi:FMNH2-dependent dimethyl sulfone monooxygenase [Amycolatopsis pretoriensis]|uniref:FMNH2-dependent dimethyl sulfone monooxygenase n=1 Tax=Amycolatopsis pretoriensis TaxID=218821 RepID=A0A1H5REY1_9PSEU|nr:LLM class flavin-dependent oxidoreductase [Amycolatopsis pretoriensis]SEF36198.1 FMNH2-dependent dimethyl sulfone monooxygenase [Amycolatopsis pretoriensis]